MWKKASVTRVFRGALLLAVLLAGLRSIFGGGASGAEEPAGTKASGNERKSGEPGAAAADRRPEVPREARVVAPLRFERFAVVSDSALASQAGAAVLAEGGNAVDAAVATAFALAVVHPAAGNIGGGGFLLARLPDGSSTSFDFREKAPLAATRDMFLDASGAYDPDRHHRSALSVGVPGTVAGLHLAHKRLGKLPWARLVDPAVKLAREGFPVSRALSDSLAAALPFLRRYPASMAQFSHGGEPLRPLEDLLQPDLARTLERIRDQGPEGFYSGVTADLIAAEMKRWGGILTREDLTRYRAVERRPIAGSYRGCEVIGMGPPSSGGIVLLEMLNILEGFDLAGAGLRSAAESHLLIEAMRRAYADRARHLGDPDLAEVPVARLVSKDHAASLRKTIEARRATPSPAEPPPWPSEGSETTHISVVDGDLLAVSLTVTLEDAYGSKIVVSGAGFLLNNECGDFNPQAGRTDKDGLIGTPPNLVEPEKRMLSSMAPTIVARDGRPWIVVGSPGGRTIINTVLEVLVNSIDHGMPLGDAVAAPRFHHQWLPDEVQAEPWCFSPETRAALEAMGHRLKVQDRPQGAAHGIAVVPGGPEKRGWLEAAVDRRSADAGASGR